MKVGVDQVLFPDATKYSLPVPDEHQHTLGDAHGGFVQWPKHLVRIGEDGVQQQPKINHKGKTAQNSSAPSLGQRRQLVDKSVLQTLDAQLKKLYNVILSLPTTNDGYWVEIENDVFQQEDDKVYVAVTDIAELLRMDWLNIPVLKVFEICLHAQCTLEQVDNIGFICPDKIAAPFCCEPDNVTALARALKEYQEKKYVLAPYYENSHWILLVISPREHLVYVLDSNPKTNTRYKAKEAMKMIFLTYWGIGGQRKKGNMGWRPLKCPQQPGGHECGYYVMKFMLEIVRHHHRLSSLLEADFGTDPYMQQQIDEVRDL